MTMADLAFTPERWRDFWKAFRSEPQQLDGIECLRQHIHQADPALLTESAEWVARFRAAPSAPSWEAPALAIIKEFEGCRLDAYRCPAGVWTIGYGTTRVAGRPVTEGDKISQDQADALLVDALRNTFAPGVLQLLAPQPLMAGNRLAALISFAYNNGLGAFKDSTLRRRLLAGESPETVVREEFPRWVHAGEAVLSGLVRRRAAEVALFCTADPGAATPPASPTPASAQQLLKVPYQSQLDNKSGTGYRECFSSSCAMLAMFWGKVASDDEYNRLRAKHGDSTDAQAQLATLRALGLHANFGTDGRASTLEGEINAGRPVAVGWLHHGPASAPSGGGHWTVVIGYTATSWIQNDPNGEALLTEGGYTPNTNGAGVVYSRKNWNPRWMPGGSGGWYLTCRPA